MSILHEQNLIAAIQPPSEDDSSFLYQRPEFSRGYSTKVEMKHKNYRKYQFVFNFEQSIFLLLFLFNAIGMAYVCAKTLKKKI